MQFSVLKGGGLPMNNANETAVLRRRKAFGFIPQLLILVFLLFGCSSGETVYMALGSPDSFGSISEMEVVTIDELDLPSESAETVDLIYKKYDGLIEDKNNRDQLLHLIASRDAEICATIVRLMPMDMLLSRGMPMRVCRDSMTELDEAFFGNEETRNKMHCGWVR
jgi:hypothetical protein